MNTRLDRLRERAARYVAAGNVEATKAVCDSILAIARDDSNGCLILADCAATQDRQRDACTLALAATTRARECSTEHQLRLAMRLFSVGEYHAAASLIRAMDLRGAGSTHLLVNLSQQLRLLELHTESLALLDAAIASGKPGAGTFFLKGNALKFLGRLGPACDEYERCLGLNPAHAGAHWALANLGLDANAGQRISRIRALLGRGGLGAVDGAYLWYALFKELDSEHDTNEAWHALENGLRLKSRLVSHDRTRESALFDRIRTSIDQVSQIESNAAARRSQPIFIVGMPRTGTTLLERVIGGNPQVTNCGELNDFRMQFKWATDHYCPGFIDHLGLDRLGSVDWANLGDRYLDHVAWRAPGGLYFTDKNPGNFMMLGLIMRALPEAKIIHMRRNPMDACFSNLKELFGGDAHAYSYDFADLASHHRSYRGLMAHWHRIAPGRILDVDYEKLVSDPHRTAATVMDYCGLGYTAAQVQSEDNATPVSSASSVQVRQPIHARNINGWKRYATQLAPLASLLQADPGG